MKTNTSTALRRFTGRTLAVATIALLSLGFTAGPSMASDREMPSLKNIQAMDTMPTKECDDFSITRINPDDGTIEMVPSTRKVPLSYPCVWDVTTEGDRVVKVRLLVPLWSSSSALGVGSGKYNLPDLPAKYDCSAAGCCVISGYASVGGSVSALGVGRDSTSNEFHYSSIGRCAS